MSFFLVIKILLAADVIKLFRTVSVVDFVVQSSLHDSLPSMC